jgi:AraC-like DNA-binding protein/putative methionine-R-sulfoxide reductase with GAF domain
MTIIQVILIDARVTEAYPGVFLFFLPHEFLAPVFFSGFTCAYLDRMWEFKRYRTFLFTPFVVFIVVYTLLKVNAAMDYTVFAKAVSRTISEEWIENIAVLFALLNGLWNYRMVKDYERGLSNLSHHDVLKKTYWLRVMQTILIALCIAWVLVIVYLKVTKYQRGMAAYYPLWLLFIGYYFVFFFLGDKHLQRRRKEEKQRQSVLENIIANFQMEGLNAVFESKELQGAVGGSYPLTRILSYFATSLFDKHKEGEVLWDIVKNCIGQLDLEDAVIYMVDVERQMLVQKAAYGNKDKGSRKILSPIEIPVGTGIVGGVAQSRQWELIDDVSLDTRYVLDDFARLSELAVPIFSNGVVIGVLDAEHTSKGFFEQRHVLIFQLVAKLTATKLEQLTKKESHTITNDNAYYKELCYLLENEKIYRDPDLSLSRIAKKLDISSTYLSQLVNTLSGANLSDFINVYRVKDAQRLLTHPNYISYSILSIGLESGFNSKSTFYAAFKKHAGMTPSAYRVNAPFTS